MWQFKSPYIVFGHEALDYLDSLQARRAFIVTDANVVKLGLIIHVADHLERAGIPFEVFGEVEPEPSLHTIRRAAEHMRGFEPDIVIGLGGGSCMDAAKAAWFAYERPDVDLAGVTPLEHFGLRGKARLIAIPTTSGTGSEATLASVLTDTDEQRKIVLGSYELVPDVAIVDPVFTMSLPPRITADTGMDVLTHAVEGFTSRVRNDFSDGLCLKAIQLVLQYLPRAYADGSDVEAREHMHNAAAIAGLGFGNSQTGLAHAMGHSLGAIFKLAHGRTVALFLPYSIEYTSQCDESRYGDIAHMMNLHAHTEAEAAAKVVERIRALQKELEMPLTIRDMGVPEDQLVEALPRLVANSEMDTQLVMNVRVPDGQELRKLYEHAYDGRRIDF